MSIVTKCPGCSTTFRVTPQQLQAQHGIVRCGRCASVFDGFKSLATLTDPAPAVPAPPVAGLEISPPAAPPAIPQQASAPEVPLPAAAVDVPPPIAEREALPPAAANDDSVLIAPSADAAIPLAAREDDPPPATPHDFAPATAAAVPRPSFEFQPEPVNTAAAFTAPSVAPMAPTLQDAPLPPGPWSPPPALSLPEATATATPQQVIAPEPVTYIENTPIAPEPVPLATAAAAAPAPRRRSGGWAFGVLLLFAALAAQGAYFYRSEIAASVPEARPYLNQTCAVLRCTVALPQRPRQISIEASDMQATDPANPGVIALTATLRNQSTIQLGYPALDVVLTNTKEHTVARRIFVPADYLAAGKDLRAGIPPNAEITVRLDLDTGDLGAAGFRLDVLAAPAR